ncbi:MAG: 1-acyl-sn-glycerol-3-phosphate acyltransferase [Myxococcales bacterium]|nr:1-acyl-sn-glycerol-3-phosphate acyltransferase [Myxococcales bacterium]
MLDLDRLKALSIRKTPWGQLAMANLALSVDYRLPRRTRIALEGLEHLPDRPVFFAMNHTDRYNYWPFQYQLYRAGHGFTAAWVKGKYYENRLMGWFMDSCTNIPLPSRGYVATTEFRKQVGRLPDEAEYRALRDLVDGGDPAGLPDGVQMFVEERGGPLTVRADFEALWAQMVGEVVRLNREAIAQGHSPLVFPQGTRSKRLSKGHVGMAQMSQLLGVDIVPVGCNGSDKAYPGGSPFSKGGEIVYRIGPPITLDGPEIGQFRVRAPFTPFTREAMIRHAADFLGVTAVVMDRINVLLDPEYQFSADRSSDGVQGVNRFV